MALNKFNILRNIKSKVRVFTRAQSTFEKQVPLVHSWNPYVEPGWTCEGEVKEGSGLVIGAYPFNDDPAQHTVCLTKTAAIFNEHTQNKLIEFLAASGPFPQLGEARTFFKLEPTFTAVTIVGLGCKDAGYSKREARDEGKENIRKAVGAGVRALQALKINKIYVEGFGHAESTAEGAALALWANQDLRDSDKRKVKIPDLDMFGCCDWNGWRIGLEKAEAQNFARLMMEQPANLMTPKSFALSAVEALCETSVNVEVRVEDWLREMGMEAFLAVAKGSVQPPVFLELSYNGCERDVPPVILIGKGVTFNSGGLCLKTPQEMKHMRGDMAGAAVVVATFKALANLGLPINVRGLVPLCENMPGASASRPGDIVKAMNGKTILVGDKYFDGQLLLADTLSYAHRFNPKYIVNVGTFTKETERCLGSTASGLYTNNEVLWQLLKAASVHSGDRLWRLPLWNIYTKEVTDKSEVDVSNMTRSQTGISSTAAAFLREFIVKNNWAHIDSYGTMREDGKTPYLRRGMAGRPTRTIIEFLGQLACLPPKPQEDEKHSPETKTSKKANEHNKKSDKEHKKKKLIKT